MADGGGEGIILALFTRPHHKAARFDSRCPVVWLHRVERGAVVGFDPVKQHGGALALARVGAGQWVEGKAAQTFGTARVQRPQFTGIANISQRFRRQQVGLELCFVEQRRKQALGLVDLRAVAPLASGQQQCFAPALVIPACQQEVNAFLAAGLVERIKAAGSQIFLEGVMRKTINALRALRTLEQTAFDRK